jgi:hypothetical protein
VQFVPTRHLFEHFEVDITQSAYVTVIGPSRNILRTLEMDPSALPNG